ncbi:MAG: hypothetical protein OTJ98_07360 [Dehalococcoidia bacterium]|nr:hypothetical protein [Dehalococcoidia bacterium]
MSSNSGNNPEMPPMAIAALERFGDRLDDQQREMLIKTAVQFEEAAEDLRKWELTNGDEPDTSFKVIEGQDS